MRGALKELLTAERSDPNLSHVQHGLGLVYHALGRPEESLNHYRRALELDPKFSEAHNNMGTLLIDLGRYDDAIAEFKVALGDILYQTPSVAEGNLGWAYVRKGDTTQGLKHLRNAVATNPKFCRGYEWLARVGIDTQDGDLTVKSTERFERYCLGDQEIAATIPAEYRRQMKYYLGLGQLRAGNRDAAREAFGQCADAKSDGFGAKCAESLASIH